jgi:hypothetical protein
MFEPKLTLHVYQAMITYAFTFNMRVTSFGNLAQPLQVGLQLTISRRTTIADVDQVLAQQLQASFGVANHAD